MAAATELISVIEAKEYLGSQSEDRLARLDQLIAASTGYCQRKVGEKILSAQYVDVLDGSGGPEIGLKHAPITKLTTIRRIQTVVPETWETVAAASYPPIILLPGRRRISFRNRWFDRGLQNWEVTYTAGWGDADGVMPIPAELKEWCLQVLLALFKHFDLHKDGIQSISISGPNGSTTTYLDQVLPKQTLDGLASMASRRWA